MEEAGALERGVRSTFTQHHEEIRRRSAIVQDGASVNSKSFPRVEGEGLDDPFVDPEQRFVVFSLSQTEFAPLPVDRGNPAVCIYGTFATREDATDHARAVLAKHPGISIMVDETHKWIVAPSTVERMSDASYIASHTERLVQRVLDDRARGTAEFNDNVENQRVGRIEEAPEDQQGDAPKAGDDSTAADACRIHRDCRLSDQKLAVISVVKDDATPPEFIFKVYACYDVDADANRYVCNVCSENVVEFDIDVVKTCAWVFPQRMQGVHAQKEVYRSPELNRVMQTHKQNPGEVERFYREHNEYETDKTAANASEKSPPPESSCDRPKSASSNEPDENSGTLI